MDRGGWWATVHGVTEKSDMTERPTLSLFQGIRRADIMVRTDPSSTPEHMSALGCHHHPHQMRRKGEQKGYTEARGRGRAAGRERPLVGVCPAAPWTTHQETRHTGAAHVVVCTAGVIMEMIHRVSEEREGS